jgi:hypothetical protein
MILPVVEELYEKEKEKTQELASNFYSSKSYVKDLHIANTKTFS